MGITKEIVQALLELMEKAITSGNQPFAALLFSGKFLLSKAHNTAKSERDPTCHAEMNVIRSAIRKHGASALTGTTLFASNEPCPMCTGAAIASGVKEIHFIIPQERLRPIRGWGTFTKAATIVSDADADVTISGPYDVPEMLAPHRRYWGDASAG